MACRPALMQNFLFASQPLVKKPPALLNPPNDIMGFRLLQSELLKRRAFHIHK
jgi:hypothetical protein